MPDNLNEYGFMQKTFPARVISFPCNINWPPRSYDLTLLNLFLWGYAKDRVYADKSSTLEILKTNIRQVIVEIPHNMYQKVFEDYINRINACATTRGGHLNVM